MPDSDLARDLARVLNIHSVDNNANTPDFILADYLIACLAVYVDTKNRTRAWHTSTLADAAMVRPPTDLTEETDQ